MKDFGKMENQMEKEKKYRKMGIVTKDIGKEMRKMEKVYLLAAHQK